MLVSIFLLVVAIITEDYAVLAFSAVFGFIDVIGDLSHKHIHYSFELKTPDGKNPPGKIRDLNSGSENL